MARKVTHRRRTRHLPNEEVQNIRRNSPREPPEKHDRQKCRRLGKHQFENSLIKWVGRPPSKIPNHYCESSLVALGRGIADRPGCVARQVQRTAALFGLTQPHWGHGPSNSGRYCYGNTPMQTFRETLHIVVEKTIKTHDPSDSAGPILSVAS